METLSSFVLFSLLSGFVNCDCNVDTGPAGSTECVLLTPYYNLYQWATCLTNQYIQTFSKGRHTCRNSFVTYCWYQCMIEVHDLEEGPVYDDCACGQDAPINVTTQPTVVTSALPDWCFSPSGQECSWYKDCLEKRYPCQEQGNSYALDYAEKFCNLYQDHYAEFDSIGQEWIDAVRKCLQVNLVPILRPFVTTSCEGIKQMAFNTHSECYLNPDTGKPSICDIGVGNWARVFWTVKGAFIQEATATFKQMLDVVQSCGKEVLTEKMKLIEMKFKQKKEIAEERMEEIAEAVSNMISEKMDWVTKNIMYFGFPTCLNFNRKKRSTDICSDSNTFYIKILISASYDFDLNADNIPIANVTAEVINVANAIENGDLRVLMEDGLEFTELSVCTDFNCTETSLQVRPIPSEETGDDGLGVITILTIVSAVVTVMIFVAVIVMKIVG